MGSRIPVRKQSTATVRAATHVADRVERVTGDPDVEDVSGLAGLVRPCPWPPIASALRGRRHQAHEVEPGVNPVLGLEMGEAHTGGTAGGALQTERHRPHHAGSVGQRDVDLERLGGAISDAPCCGRTHQCIHIELDGLDGQVLQGAGRQGPTLPLDRPPSVGGHSSHPGLEHPGGHLPLHQSHQVHGKERRRLFLGLGQARSETLTHEKGGGVRKNRRNWSNSTTPSSAGPRGVGRKAVAVGPGPGGRRLRPGSSCRSPTARRVRGRPSRSIVGRTTDGGGRSRVGRQTPAGGQVRPATSPRRRARPRPRHGEPPGWSGHRDHRARRSGGRLRPARPPATTAAIRPGGRGRPVQARPRPGRRRGRPPSRMPADPSPGGR